jgi:hypothetical protein
VTAPSARPSDRDRCRMCPPAHGGNAGARERHSGEVKCCLVVPC